MLTGPVYNAIAESKAKIIILQGGTSSGKTYAALQYLLLYAAQNKDKIITVVAQDVPNLKKGAIRDSHRIVNDCDKLRKTIDQYNKSDRTFTFHNGSIIEFSSFEDDQDAKGSRRDVLFVNECNGVDYQIYWQLSIRTNEQIILDYNPTASFWVHDNLIGKPGTELIISDHRDNPFLTAEKHAEIEGIEDYEMWKVYARGATGNIQGIVYPSWNIVEAWPDDIEEIIWGIDYGYGDSKTAGATAIIKVGIRRPATLFLKECCYHPGGMDEFTIIDTLKAYGWENGQDFYSEIDPNMIGALRRQGVYVTPAIKGERSELYGIIKIKHFSVNYMMTDSNLHWERGHYKFITVGSQVTNTVENTRRFHLMAALRYAIYTHYYSR